MVLKVGPGLVQMVAFHPGGKHVFGGMIGGIQRWQVADGHQVGGQTEMELCTVFASRVTGGQCAVLLKEQVLGTGHCSHSRGHSGGVCSRHCARLLQVCHRGH